jgi:hypothetical protein
MTHPRQLTAVIVCLAMLAGLGLTAHGLMQQSWPQVLPWDSLMRFQDFGHLILILGVWFVPAIMVMRRAPHRAWLLFALLIMIGSNHVMPAVAAICFALSALGTGSVMLKPVAHGLPTWQSLTQRFLMGAGALGTVTGLLAHAPVNYPGLYWILLMVPIWASRQTLAQDWRHFWHQSFAHDTDTRGFWVVAAETLICMLLALHLLVAMLPEQGFDALAMHLMIPDQMLSQHRWGFDPKLYTWSLMPMLADWIITPGYMLAGQAGSKLSNFCFTLVLMLQCHALVKWLGGGALASRLSLLLLLTTPLVYGMNCSMQVEMIWTSFVLAGLMSLLRVAEGAPETEDAQRDLWLAAVMIGFAVAAKAVCLSLLPVLALVAVWRIWHSRQHLHVRSVLLAALIFMVVGGIPYLTAWKISGNPVFPFFNELFKSPYFPASNFDNVLYRAKFELSTLYDLNFSPSRFMESTVGGAGFHWMLLPAAVLSVLTSRNLRGVWLLVIAAGMTYMVFQAQSYLRYVFPVLVMLAALTSASLLTIQTSSTALRTLIGSMLMVMLALNLSFMPSATWTYRHLPLEILFSQTKAEEYMAWRQPLKVAIDYVNLVNTAKAPVGFLTPQTNATGLGSPALFPSWYNPRFSTDIEAADSASTLAKAMGKWGAIYVIYDDRWGTPQQRKWMELISTEQQRFKHLSVRRLHEQ